MNQFRNIILLATALLMGACSSDTKLDEEKVVDIRTPMVFGTTSESTESTVTRATDLTQAFKVSTWKGFGSTTQQTVMDGYEVDYDATQNPKWFYENVNAQPLRYWDLSAFPYEFRGVTPYSTNATITANGITLDASSDPFQGQTYKQNVLYNVAAADPFMVAHVKREKEGTDYKDTDIIRNVEINTTSKGNATRGVHMPFHHLVSKIGFRIFINDPQPSAPNYTVRLTNVKISVSNGIGNFVVKSTGYTATNAQGLGKGTFTGVTKATANDTILLQHDGAYQEVISGVSQDLNLRNHLSQATAYDLCPDYMQQIPQGNIKLRVQLELVSKNTENVETSFTYNQLLSLDKTVTTGDDFTWDPDTRYIYYLHIPNIHGHEIELYTCEILPWEEVQSADIPIEL